MRGSHPRPLDDGDSRATIFLLSALLRRRPASMPRSSGRTIGNRTPDIRVRSAALYPLSYGPSFWRPQRDSNPCLDCERVTSLASRRWGLSCVLLFNYSSCNSGVPNGIRTRVLTVKESCPRPLDDGDSLASALLCHSASFRRLLPCLLVGPEGIEPPTSAFEARRSIH